MELCKPKCVDVNFLCDIVPAVGVLEWEVEFILPGEPLESVYILWKSHAPLAVKIHLNERRDGLEEILSVIWGLAIRNNPGNQFRTVVMVRWQEAGTILGFESCYFLLSESRNWIGVPQKTPVHPRHRRRGAVVDENVHLKCTHYQQLSATSAAIQRGNQGLTKSNCLLSRWGLNMALSPVSKAINTPRVLSSWAFGTSKGFENTAASPFPRSSSAIGKEHLKRQPSGLVTW